jgi:predicted alpha/beta superfamily hydrolase
MMKKYFLFFQLVFCLSAMSQDVKVSSGKVIRHSLFTSKFVDARNVDVWLPEGYLTSKKHAVLYMHDGQMLFDSTTTWNKQEWGIDETLNQLMKQKKIRDCIVVGVWNSGKNRHIDYFPQKPFESLDQEKQDSLYNAKRGNGNSVFSGKVQSDAYLRFLVTELKPFIDSSYATKKDRANTIVAGSSMGGLISMYAICEYPDIFGAAACLSTHWPGIFYTKNNPTPDAFMNYMKTNLPSPLVHKLYFDFGTETLDAMYEPYQLQTDSIMQARGYDSKTWMTKKFVGENHSESAWRKRFNIPAQFLLGN